MPRIDSSQLALVSYLPDEDDLDEAHRMSKAEETIHLSSQLQEIVSESLKLNENSAPNSVKSSEPADDLDSYTLLEKTFESRKFFKNFFKRLIIIILVFFLFVIYLSYTVVILGLQNSPHVELEPDIAMPPESTKRCPPELEVNK